MRRVALLLFVLICHSLKAQTNGDSINGQHIQEVVITGTRTPKLLKDVPVQTQVITSADISRSDASDISELLVREIPGVEFSYAMNQQVHMNFSGFGGQSVLFLVDGERLAGETMDDVDFSRLNMSNVERIEIIRGASSALYGSSAGGGVINIITKQHTKPLNMAIGAHLSKHNTKRYDGIVSLNGKKWGNTLSVYHHNGDNYDVKNGEEPLSRVVKTIYGSRIWNASDRIMFEPTDNLRLSARGGYYFRQLSRDKEKPERYRDFSAGVKGEWAITSQDNMELAYSFDQYDKSDFLRLQDIDVRRYSNVLHSARALYTHTQLDNNALTLGADVTREYLFNTYINGRSHTEMRMDVFAQYDYAFSNKLEVVAALRYDHVEKSSNRLTPRLNLCYKPFASTTLRLGYGMGFRTPTLKERYYDFDMLGIWTILGNENLKDERSHNLYASVDYTLSHYNFTINGFYNSVEDKIATGVPFYADNEKRSLSLQYVNLPSYHVYGAEVSAQARWRCGLSSRLSYAYTKQTKPEDAEGYPIASQYMPTRPHSITGYIDYQHKFSRNYSLQCAFSCRWLSSVDNIEYADYYDIHSGIVTIDYPSYALCRISLLQNIGKYLSVSLSVDNIFDYRPRYYYLNAPITDSADFQIGVKIKY